MQPENHHHHHDAKTAEVRCDDSPWWPWFCAFFHSRLILSGDPLPICMIQELWGRPGALRQTASGWYPDLTAITCFRIWCAGVVASNLATCQNTMWRLLIIVSVMFGRPVWTATSEFLTPEKQYNDSTIKRCNLTKQRVWETVVPSCWRVRRLALKTRATPASVRNLVSAHCFSAVSREWCISMLPAPAVPMRLLPLSSRRSDAWLDNRLTRSNSGNKTWHANIQLSITWLTNNNTRLLQGTHVSVTNHSKYSKTTTRKPS